MKRVRVAVLLGLCLLLSAAASAQSIEPLALVSQATHTAVESGNWSNPSTWGGFAYPSSFARVVIPAGVTVTVDECFQFPPFWVRVDGTLRFAPHVDTCFPVESLFTAHGSKLEIGTVAEPITATAKITIHALSGQPIDHVYDPIELSRGVVAEGLVEAHGQPKTPFVSVTQLPAVGATAIVLDTVPQGWLAGDELALTATDYDQVERFWLMGLNGSTAILSHAVQFARAFPPACAGKPCALHLANLTRNVVLRSDPANAGNPKLQGHVMLMHHGEHRLAYVQVADLGRTTTAPVTDPIVVNGVRDPSLMPNCGMPFENVRGRYPLHFHRAGPFSALSIVTGSVVQVQKNSLIKIGFENHSSNVSFRQNVSLYIDGSHFQSEEGDEVGGFEGNLAIHSTGSQQANDGNPSIECTESQYYDIHHRRRADLGHRGHGFWIHGGGVDVIDNIAAGHGSTGFEFWSRPLHNGVNNTYEVEFPVALAKEGGWWAVPYAYIGVEQNPGIWRNNTAYVTSNHKNARQAALSIHYHGLHQIEWFPKAPKNLIDGFFGWNTLNGAVSTYAGWFSFRNVTFLERPLVGREDGGVGMGLSAQGGNSNALTNVQIIGFKDCMKPSTQSTYTQVFCDGKPYIPPPPPGGR